MISILSLKDRLHKYNMKPKKITIPVLDLQHETKTYLQERLADAHDKLESTNLQLIDAQESNKQLLDDNDRLTKENNDHKARLSSFSIDAIIQDRNASVARCTSMEAQVKELEKGLNIEKLNRDHFRSLVVEQDKNLKLYKIRLEEASSARDCRKAESEHLAKQVVRLNDENSNLKTDNCNLKTLNDQPSKLMEENRKLKEQINNLKCDGCRSGNPGAYCGGCLGCITRQAEYQACEAEKELKKVKEELNVTKAHAARLTETLTRDQRIALIRLDIINALIEIAKAFKKWPCLWWNDKKKYLNRQQEFIVSMQNSIDNIRKGKE